MSAQPSHDLAFHVSDETGQHLAKLIANIHRSGVKKLSVLTRPGG